MNDDVTLLDCTLRDGGNQNAWNFSKHAVHEIVTMLDEARVPVIEVGYRGGSGSNPAATVGDSARSDRTYLEALPHTKHSVFAAMVVPTVCPLEAALDLAGTSIDIVRVAVYPWDAERAPEYVSALNNAGLRTTVNLMALSYTDETSLQAIVQRFTGDALPEVFYVADSFGALVPAQVRRSVQQIASNTTAAVGVHFHNNLGLATANTLAAIDAGATWVDASLASMARGAGNLATEQAAAIFEAAGIPDTSIDSDHVARAADFVLTEVLDRPMRTSRNELLAGLNNHHYYFQEHINNIAAEGGISARELGRRIGAARPKKVSQALVAETASAMIAEENIR